MSDPIDEPQRQREQSDAPPALSTATSDSKLSPANTATRSRSLLRPFLLEVAGYVDDEVVKEFGSQLRKLRNRYFPILRFMLTLSTTVTEEATLFGDGDGIAAPLFTSPMWAVTANKETAVVARLHPPPTGTCASVCPRTVLTEFEEYVAYRLLPMAVTHNAARLRGPSAVPSLAADSDLVQRFVLRHYVYESTRTASFLVADLVECTAALIDPTQETAVYEADLAHLGVTLRHLVVTHCFLDVRLRVDDLLARHPRVTLWSGLPLQAAGHTQNVAVSAVIVLRTIAVPSFSPECLLVELRLGGVLVALFSGTVWSTDAAPRPDVYAPFSALLTAVSDGGAGGSVASDDVRSVVTATAGFTPNVMLCSEALRVAQSNLKALVHDTYFFPLSDMDGTEMGFCCHTHALDGNEGGKEAAEPPHQALSLADLMDNVVLFPSHGGYNNVTNQLDLYWAAHIGDLVRMKHSRAVMDTLATPEAYMQYSRRLPPLPQPRLFVCTRMLNLYSLLRGRSGHVPSPPPALFPSYPPVVVDVRDAPAFHAVHLQGAVNVPMSFPAAAYGAKRAEVWLQCTLLPLQPIVAICPSASCGAAVRARMQMISPGASVAVYTPAELLPLAQSTKEWSEEAAVAEYADPSSHTPGRSGASNCTDPVSFTSTAPRAVNQPALLSGQLQWLCSRAQLDRVDTHAKLTAIEPTSTTAILDVRTPFEFKNGSHQHSVHVPLSDLCMMTAADTAAHAPDCSSSAQSPTSHGPSPDFGRKLLEQMCNSVANSGVGGTAPANEVDSVVVYCAGGYRSLIAASLLQRAFEVSALPSLRRIRVSDVRGGAFQIMTQRPDLWVVKDRSIICIS